MRKVVPEYVFSRLAPHSSAESIHSASSAKLQLHFAAVPTAVFGTAGLKKHSAAAFMDSANGLR